MKLRATTMTSAKAAVFAVALVGVWLTGIATEIEHYEDPDLDEHNDDYESYEYGSYDYDSFDDLDDDTMTAGGVVFGGTPAGESFGYMVAVGRPGSTFCGGWLYDEHTVITAAQCVEKRGFGLHVIVDRYDLRSRTEGQVINVAKVLIYSGYDETTRNNDIAILKLQKPAKIDVPYAKPIGEVSRSQLVADTELIVLGWGMLENMVIPTDLRQGTVGYVDSRTCDEEYYGNLGNVTDQMVCARSTNSQEACAGDMGGPLVLQNLFGADEVVGIVSWGGEGCNVAGAPTVYTALTEDIKVWINAVARSF